MRRRPWLLESIAGRSWRVVRSLYGVASGVIFVGGIFAAASRHGAVAAYLFSAALAWIGLLTARDAERELRDVQELAEARGNLKAIRQQLGTYVDAGNWALGLIRQDTKGWERHVQEWADEIDRFVGQSLGDDYVSLLNNDYGAAPAPWNDATTEQLKFAAGVSFRLGRLDEFIRQLQAPSHT